MNIVVGSRMSYELGMRMPKEAESEPTAANGENKQKRYNYVSLKDGLPLKAVIWNLE